MADKKLTEKQQLFIKLLVWDGLGPVEACKKAGYSDSNAGWLTDVLSSEIVAETERWLAQHAPAAVRKLVTHMGDDAVEPGAEKRLEAVKQILDRIGLTKKERPQTVNATQVGLVFLPAKNVQDTE